MAGGQSPMDTPQLSDGPKVKDGPVQTGFQLPKVYRRRVSGLSPS